MGTGREGEVGVGFGSFLVFDSSFSLLPFLVVVAQVWDHNESPFDLLSHVIFNNQHELHMNFIRLTF